jgi:glycosyltransferase involved in cell wall biosynthesis
MPPPHPGGEPGAAPPGAAPPFVLAVEATRLAGDERGLGRYVRALLPRLVALRPGLRLALFVKPRHVARVAAAYADAPATRGRVDVRPVRALRRTRADAYWFPWNVARPAPRRGVVVATVHDIVPVALPDPRLRSWRRNRRWRREYAATAERATILLVPSAFTAEELRRVFAVPAERTRVTPLAADDVEPPPPDADAAVLARLGVRRPYVLAVGASEPRKNLEALDRAMPRVAAAVPGATLVLAGPRRDTDPLGADAPWKHTLGYVDEADLPSLYRAAACLAMPSTYEGFGLPVLEAMRLGTPVVATRRASLPEVGGDAAAWVEPGDDAQLAAALTRVLTDRAAGDAMRAAGLARAARFAWDETARLTLAALDDAVALGERPAAGLRWPGRPARRAAGPP